ncbi:MAG: hypothetical protein CFH05_00771 [Alphaproteobacteria bacterium MarineAlpha3_Bin4]|nr:MAG: hypothetical protein CFH05_00771 [Alphaproteobacteria bacterium MarineAlpha3_Bin4]
MQLARSALAWERLWPRLWPAVAIVCVFFAVALLDLLPLLSVWLHSLVLIAFAGLIGYALHGVFSGDYRVCDTAARQRLERDSGLAHRPLTALQDTLASGADDEATSALWQVHLQRMAEVTQRLHVRLPSPGMTARDPYGLRAVAVLLLVIGLAASGGETIGPLQRAVVPEFGAGGDDRLTLDVWVMPPAFTGLAPIFLERAKLSRMAMPVDQPTLVRIPVGSTILAQTSLARTAPELRVGGRVTQFAPIGESEDPGGFRVEVLIGDADQNAADLVVEINGRQAGQWPIEVIADTPPEVEFLGPPKRTGRSYLRLDYEARDDYALASVQAVIRHREGHSVPGGDNSIRIELPTPGLGLPLVKGNSIQDMTAHPWAGLPVEIRLHALDARGQAGASDAFAMVLPERVFNHPVARAIFEVRKQLNTPDAAVVTGVVGALEKIASRPHHFYNDTVVFLALVIARSRLTYARSDAVVASVQNLLWETAIRIEDGDFALVERDLREIQDRLMAAMRNRAKGEELEGLMDELQQVLDKYMAALAKHLKREGLTDLPLSPSAQIIENSNLQWMIDQTREMAQTGALEAAQRMLSQLNRMLDSIRQGARMAGPTEELKRVRQLVDGLRSLTQRQQRLLDETFRQMQRDQARRQSQNPGALQTPKPGQPGPQDQLGQWGEGLGYRSGMGMARDQELLRHDLGRLMLQMDEMLGTIPSSLGQAERSMRGATRSLNQDGPAGAVLQQTEAVEKLRQATKGLAEQMARRFGSSIGMILGRPGTRQDRSGRDPFGRNPGGAFGALIDDGDVRVPTQMEMRRAREIVDELRRRSGERYRPQPELNYIERLLRRF